MIFQKELRQLVVIDGLYKLRSEESTAADHSADMGTDCGQIGDNLGITSMQNPGEKQEPVEKSAVSAMDPACIQPVSSLDAKCIQTGYKPDTDRIQSASGLDAELDQNKIKGNKEIEGQIQFNLFQEVETEREVQGKDKSIPRGRAREEARGRPGKVNAGKPGHGEENARLEVMMEQARLPDKARAGVRKFCSETERLRQSQGPGNQGEQYAAGSG